MTLTTILVSYLVAWFVITGLTYAVMVGLKLHTSDAWVNYQAIAAEFAAGNISLSRYLKFHFSPKATSAFYADMWKLNKPFTVWMFIASCVFLPMTIIGDLLSAFCTYLLIRKHRGELSFQ